MDIYQIPAAPASMDEHLPVFVYGTLMAGFHNYDYYLKGQTEKETPATVSGELFAVTGGSFPCLKLGNEIIAGMVIDILPCHFVDTLQSLDRLEGYCSSSDSGMYLRRKVSVITVTGKKTPAWIYYWNSDTVGEKIVGGSFARYLGKELTPNLILSNMDCREKLPKALYI